MKNPRPLHFLGFISLPQFPKNVALEDILTAIKWVKENIASLGGDNTRISVMGHGSGAALASLLSRRKETQALIHRLILMSGSSLAPWAVTDHAEHSTKELVQNLNCTMQTADTCLLQMSMRQIVEAVSFQDASQKSINKSFLYSS